MRALGCMAVVMAAATLSQARADDTPSYLADGGLYVSDIEACSASNPEEADGLQLTTKGLFGYEFGCTFASFLPVRLDDGDDQPDQHIAVASCSDDSGITRPDMILLSPSDDGSLFVTSQNDYAIQSVWEKDRPSGIRWLVQREFLRCPK